VATLSSVSLNCVPEPTSAPTNASERHMITNSESANMLSAKVDPWKDLGLRAISARTAPVFLVARPTVRRLLEEKAVSEPGELVGVPNDEELFGELSNSGLVGGGER